MEQRGEKAGIEHIPDRNEPHTTAEVIPVIMEELHVEKTTVEKGRILIHKKIHSDNQTVEIPLNNHSYHIERVEINQYVENPPPPVRYEDDTMIIPVLKEVMVKRILVEEEIRITPQVSTQMHKETVSIRREEVTIERKDN